MEVIKLDETNIVNGITSYITQQKEGIVYGIPREISVFVGRNSEELYDKQFCLDNNVNLLQFPNEGGIIVVNNGDFDIGHFSYNFYNKFNENFAQYVVDYLVNKGIKASIVNNDILIDNIYKCCGFSSRLYGKVLYSAFHVSINVDIDLIKNICKKKMVKIPKGLSDYDITTQEILNLFRNFINNN